MKDTVFRPASVPRYRAHSAARVRSRGRGGVAYARTLRWAAKCKEVDVDMEPRRGLRASDHTFLWAEFDS